MPGRKRFCDSIDTLYVTRLRTEWVLWLRITHARETQPFFGTAYKYTNTRGEEGMRDEGGEEKEKNKVVSSIFFFCRQTRPTGSGYACSSSSSSIAATLQQCLLMCRVCAGPHDMPSDDTVWLFYVCIHNIYICVHGYNVWVIWFTRAHFSPPSFVVPCRSCRPPLPLSTGKTRHKRVRSII